jgi:hypothetical protein
MLTQYQHSHGHLCSYRLRNMRAGYVLYRTLVDHQELYWNRRFSLLSINRGVVSNIKAIRVPLMCTLQ